jgi:hypothetical protein
MEWRQSSAGRSAYELWADGKQLASLTSSGLFHSKTMGETAFDAYEIATHGFLGQRFSVRTSKNAIEVASATWNSWNGETTIALSNGVILYWKVQSIWKGMYQLTDMKQNVLVEITQGLHQEHSGVKDWFKTQARVLVTPHGQSPETLLLLTLLSWFFVLHYLEVASSSAVVT